LSEYGIPYQGSKCSIAEKICTLFPPADNFYDLFGGGFSITHCMLQNRRKDFKQFHFNEPRKGIVDLIKKSINGDFNYSKFHPPWISKKEFDEKKETDAYIKIIWSFGNNGKNYLFSEEKERIKKSLHNAVVFNEFDGFATEFFGFNQFKNNFDIIQRRLFVQRRIRYLKSGRVDLEQLERLEQLQRLEFYTIDYHDVPIKENSIIYCDIPYKNTASYDSSFNHDEFFSWVEKSHHPIFISEYYINKPFLKYVYSCSKLSRLSPKGRDKKDEKIYANIHAMKLLCEKKQGRIYV